MGLVQIVDAQVPIERLLDRLGKRDFHKAGDFVSCPGHSDSRPSLKVNGGRRGWHCFQCGKGGWSSAYMAILRGVSLREGASEVAKLFALSLSREVFVPETDLREKRLIFDAFYWMGIEKSARESAKLYAETQSDKALGEVVERAGETFLDNYFNSLTSSEAVSGLREELWSYLQMVEETYEEWRRDAQPVPDVPVLHDAASTARLRGEGAGDRAGGEDPQG